MRYKLHLSKVLRSNFILLPASSPLRHSLANKSSYLSSETSSVTPIKLTSLASDHHISTFFFGYSGGTSLDDTHVEISEGLGRLLGLQEGDLVEAAIEYSYEKLKQVELEPVTADDFEVIERNSGYIEE